jgi:hypothetical protein
MDSEELLMNPSTLLSEKALFERYQNEIHQEFAA